MNTGQTMLAMGAMMLLSILVLRVNSTQLVTQDTITDSKLGIVALTIANSYMDFAKRQVFDKAVGDTTISGVDIPDLTLPSSLGPEGGESYPNFNDIDDFNLWDPAQNRFLIIPDTTTLANANNTSLFTKFNITSSVYYVNESNFDVKVSTRTWFKRIDVKVWTDGMSDTLKYSSISTIW